MAAGGDPKVGEFDDADLPSQVLPSISWLPRLHASVLEAPAGLPHQNPEHSKENYLAGDRNV